MPKLPPPRGRPRPGTDRGTEKPISTGGYAGSLLDWSPAVGKRVPQGNPIFQNLCRWRDENPDSEAAVRGPRFHENHLRHLSEGERFSTSEGRVRGRQETN